MAPTWETLLDLLKNIWIFQFCCVTNKATVNFCVQRFIWIWNFLTLGKELEVKWLNYIVGLYLTFSEISNHFQS